MGSFETLRAGLAECSSGLRRPALPGSQDSAVSASVPTRLCLLASNRPSFPELGVTLGVHFSPRGHLGRPCSPQREALTEPPNLLPLAVALDWTVPGPRPEAGSAPLPGVRRLLHPRATALALLRPWPSLQRGIRAPRPSPRPVLFLTPAAHTHCPPRAEEAAL